MEENIKKLLISDDYKNFKLFNEEKISLDVFYNNNYENIIIPNNYFYIICESIKKDFIYENKILYNNNLLYVNNNINLNEINNYYNYIENKKEIIIDKTLLNINFLQESILSNITNSLTGRNTLGLKDNNDEGLWQRYIDTDCAIDDLQKIIDVALDNFDPSGLALKISGLSPILKEYKKQLPTMTKMSIDNIKYNIIPNIIKWAIKNRHNTKFKQDIIANKILNMAIEIKKRNKLKNVA